MAATIQGLVAEIREFVDITDAQALEALNRRHKRMVSRSRSLRDLITVGTTTAGTGSYTVSGVVEVLDITVDGVPFARGRYDDLYASRQSRLRLSDSAAGLFVVRANTTSEITLTLVPTPDTSGLDIKVIAAILPDDLPSSGDAGTYLKVDADYYDVLVEAAAATWLKRQGEGDPGTLEAQFDQACEEYRRQVDRRFRAQGPPQIRVQGINA